MRIAVCDDELEWIKQLEEYINTIQRVYTGIDYDVFSCGEELLRHYDMHGDIYDVVIIDIEMQTLSGITVAQRIRDRDADVAIFFLTSHREYVYDCFKPMPMDFWIKPLTYDKFKEGIKRVCKRIESSMTCINIIEDRKRVRIKCKDIIYIENKERKSYIYTTHGTHRSNRLLSEFMTMLDARDFVRVYKSYIVNLAYVYKVSDHEIILYECSEHIPISRTYKSEFIGKFMNFKEKEDF